MAQKDIQEDLTQLKAIYQSVKRPDNVKLIQQQIKSLETKIEKLRIEVPARVEHSVPQVKKVAATEVVSGNFVTITNYSYDQEGSKVKQSINKCRVYLTLDDISKYCKQDQIKVTFTNDSIDVKIYGYKGLNYCFAVRKLNGKIDPSKSKFTLKTNSLILTLTKEQSKHWDGLPYKDSKFDVAPEKSKDPQAGLMDMMKKMYEEGDDNMKRTIAQTWSKSQNK